MGITGWIVIGLIAGAIARWIMPGPDPMGWLGTIVLGIVGSLVGGTILNLLFGGGLELSAAGILDRLAVAEEERGLAHDQPPEEGDAAAPPADGDVYEGEGRGGDDPTGERVVAAGHRVLDRVRDDEDHDEIERCHLAELALAGQAQQHEHDHVHDERPQQDLVSRRGHDEDVHGVSPRASACR